MRTAIVFVSLTLVLAAQPRGWVAGKGYGWVYGPQDEVGALNAVTSPAQVLRALRDVKTGKIYDLGVKVDASSYKWPGHSPTTVMSFRSPEGVKRGGGEMASHPKGLAWHSCALFISDNVGTQIDGLGHVTTGTDNHWYNGFKESEYGTDFGIARADADTIPPVVARAVLIDVAGWRQVEALPRGYAIGSSDLRATLAAQKVDVEPGDVVMVRTGTLRHWGETGADHAKIAEHDSAGITLEAARWLVEQKGAVLIGSDTSGLEAASESLAVHEYLLVEQGVHIGEFHYLEDLARDRVYRFVYVAMTNRIKGTVAGTALRPLAIR